MTWATITAAVDTLVATLSGMVLSPVVLRVSDAPFRADGVGPNGGHFWIEYPEIIAEPFDGRRVEHIEARGLLTFCWTLLPDPATRRGEAMDRADAIRTKLANETTAATDLRCNPGGFTCTTTADGALVFVEIPFTLTGDHAI